MSEHNLRIETRTGAAILPLLPQLGRLRTTVFRDWPYLYDGEDEYEVAYMRTYAESPRAAIIVAFAGETVIGASTCLPMQDETENVQAPFRARGWDVARFFYFGESVLLKEYRQHGLGVRFFEEREAHARRVSDADFACFCSVVRPENHPARPPGAVPLNAFWTKRGFTPRPDLACTMSWKEVGAAEETEHTLTFWMKSLTGVPLP